MTGEEAAARAAGPAPTSKTRVSAGSMWDRSASTRPRPSVMWPTSPVGCRSTRLTARENVAAGERVARCGVAWLRSGPESTQPRNPIAATPPSAAPIRSGATSSVRNRQSSDASARARSWRY